MDIKVKIKKLHDEAVIPKYSREGDAFMDIVATSYRYDEAYHAHIYGTGLAFELPKGTWMDIRPRSSIFKVDALQTNHCGVLDSGYRGELLVIFKNIIETPTSIECANRTYIFAPPRAPYKVGDRIAQIQIKKYPNIIFEEVDSLSDSERGTGGHGSTGK
jgi:dUTP pyrophosphatase